MSYNKYTLVCFIHTHTHTQVCMFQVGKKNLNLLIGEKLGNPSYWGLYNSHSFMLACKFQDNWLPCIVRDLNNICWADKMLYIFTYFRVSWCHEGLYYTRISQLLNLPTVIFCIMFLILLYFLFVLWTFWVKTMTQFDLPSIADSLWTCVLTPRGAGSNDVKGKLEFLFKLDLLFLRLH